MKRNIYQDLIVLMTRSRRQMSKLCEQRELTPVQGILLILLQPGEPRTMNELSEMMGCDASNVTGLIDRLESQGLIERVAETSDRRVKKIRLSSSGKKCRNFLLDGLHEASVVELEALDSQEISQLQTILSKLI